MRAESRLQVQQAINSQQKSVPACWGITGSHCTTILTPSTTTICAVPILTSKIRSPNVRHRNCSARWPRLQITEVSHRCGEQRSGRDNEFGQSTESPSSLRPLIMTVLGLTIRDVCPVSNLLLRYRKGSLVPLGSKQQPMHSRATATSFCTMFWSFRGRVFEGPEES